MTFESKPTPPESSSPRPSPLRLEFDLAWAAGFVDGEGCIHIARQRYGNRRRPTYRLGVYVTQNDRSVLESFVEAVGIKAPIYAVKQAPNHKRQCFTLNYCGKAALQLLEVLMPYLRRKRREACAALEFWTRGRMGVPGGGRPLDPVVVALREHYLELMRQLK